MEYDQKVYRDKGEMMVISYLTYIKKSIDVTVMAKMKWRERVMTK